MSAKKRIVFDNQPSLFDWDNIERADYFSKLAAAEREAEEEGREERETRGEERRKEIGRAHV